jgi:hypothetical protein
MSAITETTADEESVDRLFDLNIEEVLDHWEVEHAIREVIANAAVRDHEVRDCRTSSEPAARSDVATTVAFLPPVHAHRQEPSEHQGRKESRSSTSPRASRSTAPRSGNNEEVCATDRLLRLRPVRHTSSAVNEA